MPRHERCSADEAETGDGDCECGDVKRIVRNMVSLSLRCRRQWFGAHVLRSHPEVRDLGDGGKHSHRICELPGLVCMESVMADARAP